MASIEKHDLNFGLSSIHGPIETRSGHGGVGHDIVPCVAGEKVTFALLLDPVAGKENENRVLWAGIVLQRFEGDQNVFPGRFYLRVVGN